METRELYLNHAATSWPKPGVVLDAVQEAMTTAPAHWPYRFDEVHQAIAEYFGVSNCEQILLTPGCTSALAVGIGDALIASGGRVLTSQWEHHALHRPVLKLAAAGVRVEYIPPEGSKQPYRHVSPIDLNWLEQALAMRDVGLVAITAACNVTGELMPYDEVIRLAHRYGSMVLVDAAQIVGWQKLDLPRLDADMVAFGGHKGLQAPWGIGGLYLSDRADGVHFSSMRIALSRREQWHCDPRPGYCDVGSVDQYALAGLHAAVGMLRAQTSEAHLARARRQIQRIGACLEPIDRLRIIGPAGSKHGMPTLALAVARGSSSEFASLLKRHGLMVGSGIHCAPLAHETLGTQDTGLVRVSVGLAQADEEIDETIDRLQVLLHEEFHPS